MAVSLIGHEEALTLVGRPDVVWLDVRTRQEFVERGHVPGARLLPVDLVASGLGVLDPATTVVVYCEHGIRSTQAAQLLDRAGIARVRNLSGGMSAWAGPRVYDDAEMSGPSEWLIEHADALRGAHRVLDVACGRGRHALLLASAGFDVTAIDKDVSALDHIAAVADRTGWPIRTVAVDLETFPAPSLEMGAFDVILVFRYLSRPLFPALAKALKPGGRLIYETFLTAQAALGHPKNPRFLLAPGELAGLLRGEGLQVEAFEEGLRRGQHVASAVARKN